MASPSTMKLPKITGVLNSNTSKPIPESLEITDLLTATKSQGNVAGQALYEYGTGGIKPNTLTIRKGRVNKFGLQTISWKAQIVPFLTDVSSGNISCTPRTGHVMTSGAIQLPVEWPEQLMCSILTATVQSLTGVVFATSADVEVASTVASNVVRGIAAGEV